MRVVKLSANHWKSTLDFYDAIGVAQYEHDGRSVANTRNINGLLELLVWDVCNGGSLPYTFLISGTSNLYDEIRCEIELVRQLLVQTRSESLSRRGFDVPVSLEIAD